MITVNCELNAYEDKVYPIDTGAWSDLTGTWDEWITWYFDSPVTVNWRSETYDLIVAQDFNLVIETVANGSVAYEVYTSSTGLFAGEETTVSIDPGASNVSGFHGRYYCIAVKVTKTNQDINTISSIQITTNRQTISETITDVDTSGLNGSITARSVPITKRYSKISAIDVSVQEITAYALDLYVSNYATSKTLLPRVVSKSRSNPTIALLGIDGSTKNGTVDIQVTGLPEQYMQGNNLYNG